MEVYTKNLLYVQSLCGFLSDDRAAIKFKSSFSKGVWHRGMLINKDST